MSNTFTAIAGTAFPIAVSVLGFFRPADAAKLAGTLLTGAGSYGWAQPLFTAKTFGIPFATPTHALFVPALAGRNLAAGLSTLTISILADRSAGDARKAYRTALGALLLFWTFAGYADCYILMTTEGSDNLGTHVGNIGILTVTGVSLLLGR